MKNTILTEATKISALSSSGKIDKYEYLTDEEILPSDQSKVYIFPYCKAFAEEIKTIEDQGTKQVEALKALKPEEN